MKTRLILLVSILFGSVQALAWDTKEHEPTGVGEREKWLSIYLCLHGSGGDICSRNEHELLANDALDLAVSAHNWNINERTDFSAVDLNASLFRPALADLSTFPSSQGSDFPLERRTLPAPPHFAGIPDFSYTIYDWANKNELCPARPANDQQLDYCHVYALWHGAGFNSSHFGSQATASYQVLHATALQLADDAAQMLGRISTEDERKAHEAAVREAELLALAYESYAQHFLADRWASGHMWDRWGAPEFNAAAYGNDMGTAVVTGLFTGIIHGYESVADQNVPDLMSSPEYLSNETWGILPGMYTSEWRYANGSTVFEGVGDYRLEDMLDGHFGAEYLARGYFDRALNVSHQQDIMMECLTASFVEVISRFGRNDDGTIGIDRVQIRTGAPSGVSDECLNPWATNRAIEAGWGGEGDLLAVTGLGAIARYVPALKTDASISELGAGGEIEAQINSAFDRVVLAAMTARINMRAFVSPNGIDLAQGGIGPYGRAQQGGAYPVASYFEPADLDTLPDYDIRGRDRQSLFGLFNRAGARYFCTNTDDYLMQYRGSDDDRERAACRMLAQRMYSGTWEEYQGQQAETQSVDYNYDVGQVRPLCQIAGDWMPPANRTDDIPNRLHPGYVPWTHSTARIDNNQLMPDGQPNNTHAFLADNWGLSNQSIASWCDTVPVIDYLTTDEDIQRDIVARITDAEETITLTGLHFGDQQGKLSIGLTGTDAIEVTEVESWSDTRITFSLSDVFSEIQFDENGMIFVFVDRVAVGTSTVGLQSVGRFALLDAIERPEVVRVRISRGDTVFLDAQDLNAQPADPGPFAQDIPVVEPGPFRPIDPGRIQFDLTFDRPMNTDPEETLVLIGQDHVTGEWISETEWRGYFELLAGDFLRSRVGFHAIQIQAKAENGGRIDSDPSTPGEQPYSELEAAIDTIPIWVDEIEVRQGRDRIYAAHWIGGPDLEDAPNLTHQVLGDQTRGLNVTSRTAPPADGEGTVEIRLSAGVSEAPHMTIGNVTVDLTGEGTEWEGTFDYAEVGAGMNDGRIQIIITATDDATKGLDGDPRTVTQIYRDPEREEVWIRYEHDRGGINSQYGGWDDWHFLAAPVDLSFVIVLDASGSMGDGTGRMELAKSGIADTLTQMPADLVVEVGAVVFYNCRGIEIRPFTRDLEAMNTFIQGVQPSQSTALGEALEAAAWLFDSSADPAATEWRFASFTDGDETCGGNVAAAMQALTDKTREHTAVLQNEEPEDPPEPEPVVGVECRPASWRAYQVDVGSAITLPRISLVEHWYLERALPDGRCFARLQSETRHVYYGEGSAASGWGVNSNVSLESSEFGSSSQGIEDLNRVRRLAETIRNTSTDLQSARSQISDAVRQALE